MPHSEVHHRLRVLGINQSHIIDVHFPTTGIVGLLIHRSFEYELTALLKKGGIMTKDIDPRDATVIKDPQLATTTEPGKTTKAISIHQQRILRSCQNMPNAHIRLAVMRFFASTAYEGPTRCLTHFSPSTWQHAQCHPSLSPNRTHIGRCSSRIWRFDTA